MKKIFKFILFFIIILFFINGSKVYADTMLTDAISGGKDFLGKANEVMSDEQKKSLQETSSSVYNTLLLISFVVVAVVGISLGIKFMIGGAEEKAHIKELLVPYIVGCIVIFGAFAIWKIVVTILSNSLA